MMPQGPSSPSPGLSSDETRSWLSVLRTLPTFMLRCWDLSPPSGSTLVERVNLDQPGTKRLGHTSFSVLGEKGGTETIEMVQGRFRNGSGTIQELFRNCSAEETTDLRFFASSSTVS